VTPAAPRRGLLGALAGRAVASAAVAVCAALWRLAHRRTTRDRAVGPACYATAHPTPTAHRKDTR
jgi:hypothetical protein